MNRRKFLSWLAIAPAVVAAAPILKQLVPIESGRDGYRTYITGKDAIFETNPETIAEYKRLRDERGPNSWVSYKFHMTATLPPNASMRIKYIDAARDV